MLPKKRPTKAKQWNPLLGSLVVEMMKSALIGIIFGWDVARDLM